MNTWLWKDVEPDPRLVEALDAADAGAPRPDNGSTDEKRNWGTRFADHCAVMVARELREVETFCRRFEIRPNPDGSGRESLTGVAGKGKKKVDVIVSSLASGLQVAISLKAENFPSKDGNYGKNITNRLYELQDEVRAIHEYQPRAYVAGLFFLPLPSVSDRTERSTFARTVANLRARSGRTDPLLLSQINKLDSAVVGLYVPKDIGKIRRGVVRYFDASLPPPKVGRPRIPSTMSLDDLVAQIARHFEEDAGEIVEYADPEQD